MVSDWYDLDLVFKLLLKRFHFWDHGYTGTGSHLKLIPEGKKVRTGRISLRDLEVLSEIDYGQIHRIEKGQTSPDLLTLIAFAKALETSLIDLISFE